MPQVVPSALCPLVHFCIHISNALPDPPKYFKLVTCGSWADCIFLIMFHSDTCILSMSLHFHSSPRLPSTSTVPSPTRISPLHTAPHYLRTQSANMLLTFLPSRLCRMFFSRSINTLCKYCCPSPYLSCSCTNAKLASVDFSFTNANCSS